MRWWRCTTCSRWWRGGRNDAISIDRRRVGNGLPGARGRRAQDRAQGLDARGLPQEPDPADIPACPLRDHRDAAGGQLDKPGAHPAPENDPAGQGAGRGRARFVPLQRRGDLGRDPRRNDRSPARRASQICLHLQLSHAHLGRHRDDRLAGGRGRHRQPDFPAAHLVRAVFAGHGPDLQGRKLSPAPGLRDSDDAGGG